MKDLFALQNGSDIRGVAIFGDEPLKNKLGDEEARRIAKAFCLFLSEKEAKGNRFLTVAVGRDSRLTGETLARSLEEALCACGCKVLSCGLASTPAMFMATRFSESLADGAIMVTASHMPKDRNGFKFFTKDGGLEKADISKILSLASDERTLSKMETSYGNVAESFDIISLYSDFLRNKIKEGVNAENYEKPLQGLKIAVDAGNGSGGFYASKVLEPLGADISASQFLEPDGSFPNHIPNPEDEKAMQSISEQVCKTKADFGIIFDTDVDRAGAVNSDGREISRNAMIAVAAALLKEEGTKETTVVTDSVTSDQLTEFIEKKLGFRHHRFKRGYKNVINESLRLNAEGEDSALAIETSGHAAFKENFFLDDGAYLATKIVVALARLKATGDGIDKLLSGFTSPEESIELRLPINAENFGEIGDKVIADLKNLSENGMKLVTPNYEGVRISFDNENGNGWALLRKSLHESLMPLNIESDEVGGCDKIKGKMKEILKVYKELDISKL